MVKRFDTVQVKAVEQIRSAIDQPALHQHGLEGKDIYIGESEMNNLKRHQQPHLTKVTFYCSSNL